MHQQLGEVYESQQLVEATELGQGEELPVDRHRCWERRPHVADVPSVRPDRHTHCCCCCCCIDFLCSQLTGCTDKADTEGRIFITQHEAKKRRRDVRQSESRFEEIIHLPCRFPAPRQIKTARWNSCRHFTESFVVNQSPEVELLRPRSLRTLQTLEPTARFWLPWSLSTQGISSWVVNMPPAKSLSGPSSPSLFKARL